MNVWQVFAAALAAVLPLIALIRMARSPRWNVLILLLQIIGIPEIGFVVYALSPTAIPSLDLLLPAAILLYGGAIGAMVWSLSERRKLMRPVITLEAIDRQHLAALLARLATVILLSAVVFVFEPLAAVINLAANAAYTLAWIPRRFRRVHVDTATEIAVPPNVVFDFVSNPDNWPRYRDDFVSASPPGPLAVGTTVVTRIPVVQLSRPNPNFARFAEVQSVVTSLTPGRSFSVAVVGRPAETSSSEVEVSDSGSTVATRADGLLTFAQAALGFRFELPRLMAVRRGRMAEAAARLKDALEGSDRH